MKVVIHTVSCISYNILIKCEASSKDHWGENSHRSEGDFLRAYYKHLYSFAIQDCPSLSILFRHLVTYSILSAFLG